MLTLVMLLACSAAIEGGGPEAPVAAEEIDTGPPDEDGDGFDAGEDCDDTRADVFPGAEERCDEIDNDCDERIDAAAVDGIPWYTDADGDGWGAGEAVTVGCWGPADSVDRDGDCDDDNADANPRAFEVCDAANVDEDCSGAADDDDPGVDEQTKRTFYPDDDEDGFGDPAGPAIESCDTPDGYVSSPTDCDPSDPDVNPLAAEVCDADDVDEDCDGLSDDADDNVDDDGWSAWYVDADGDGYGVGVVALEQCDAPATGYATETGDCDDGEAARNPGEAEVCDDLDNDCDGVADDGDGSVTGRPSWYRDRDEDGYGDASTTYARCDAPSGYVADDTDCDDDAASVHPDADEICDLADLDEDCDGLIDEADCIAG